MSLFDNCLNTVGNEWGIRLNDEGKASLEEAYYEVWPSSGVCVKNICDLVCRKDLRKLGVLPPVSETILKSSNGALPCRLFCQILSVRDMTLPLTQTEEDFSHQEEEGLVSSSNRRILMLTLTNGVNRLLAFEYKHCPLLGQSIQGGTSTALLNSNQRYICTTSSCSNCCLPGTKLLIEKDSRICNGMILLEPQKLVVVGGEVQRMADAYRVQEEVTKFRSAHEKLKTSRNSSDGLDENPPMFEKFTYEGVKKAVRETSNVVTESKVASTSQGNLDKDDRKETKQQLKELTKASNIADSKLDNLKKKGKLDATTFGGAFQTMQVRNSRSDGQEIGRRGRGCLRGRGRGRARGREDYFDENDYVVDSSKTTTFDLTCFVKDSESKLSKNSKTKNFYGGNVSHSHDHGSLHPRASADFPDLHTANMQQQEESVLQNYHCNYNNLAKDESFQSNSCQGSCSRVTHLEGYLNQLGAPVRMPSSNEMRTMPGYRCGAVREKRGR